MMTGRMRQMMGTKVAREFIDGKHTDIYNELKQMVLDKEAM